MIKNYFVIAFRNFARNKVYSFINIAGLSIGLACVMLIVLYVKDETSFDKFNKNVNNIYRIAMKANYQGQEREDGNTGFLQGPRFTQNVPGIRSFVRVQSGYEDLKTGNEVEGQGLLYVDSNFFSVFTFPLLDGNPATCLKEPHSIVLSEDLAKKQFGSTNAVGKIVMIKDGSAFIPYKVTAVAKRCPQNSSIRFDALLPFIESGADARNNDNWYNFFLNTFVVLDNKANVQTVEKQMQAFYVKDAKATFDEMVKKYGGSGGAEMGTYFLQPYAKMHLDTKLSADNGLQSGSNPLYSYILSGIALFILLIACINFVNLTVARSVKRAKEIGIRKVVGGSRKQLIKQFLSESFLLCFIAFLLALLITQLVLPFFNTLANKQLSLSYLFDARLITTYVLLFILTGLLAGFYPALVLSGFDPVKILYNKFSLTGRNYLQKSLVIFQFVLASFLIIITFVLYMQFNHLTHAKLGYDDSNIVLVNESDVTHSKASVVKTMLLKNPDIIDVAPKNAGTIITGGKLSTDSTIQFHYETVDESFLPELRVPIVQGRNFSTTFPSDPNNSILVNEAFVKKAGWTNPIGEIVNLSFDTIEDYRVIGVVKDYHYASMNEEIGPQLFTMKNANLYGTFYIKIKPNTASESLKFIQKTFHELFPLNPYSYVFKNDENRQYYSDVAKWKQIILFGALLTIFISCIGLFGLSILSAEKRTKEIGIRRVLGASVQQIATTLSAGFIKLVAIALAIASPLAYLAANKWLQNFSYRITISWWLFALVAVIVVFIALATVSFQAIKAAMANPVKNLRME